MTVTLTPKAEDRLRHWVETGHYLNMDDALDAAVALFDEHNRMLALQAALTEADNQTHNGEVEAWSPELRARIRREAEERFARGEKPAPHVCP